MRTSRPFTAPSRLARHAGLAIALALALAATGTRADEGGVPFWFSGQYSSFAAVPAAPGLYATVMPYLYGGSASGSKSFPRGDEIAATIDAQVGLLLAQVSYAPPGKVLDGQLVAGLAFGGGFNSVQAMASTSIGSTVLARDIADSKTGGTDLYPIVDIAWNNGVHNWMTYLTGDLPVGAYDPNRLANLGIGHYAVDVGGAYTYLNLKTGLEASAVVGFTFNFENNHTSYTNGIDSHLDWAVSQFLTEAFQVGLVGYAYWQLTADTYPAGGIDGAVRQRLLGTNQSGVASLGGEVGALLTVAGQQGYLNLRGYWEFWAERRLQGWAIFGTISIPIHLYK